MKRENFEKVEELLRKLDEINTSIKSVENKKVFDDCLCKKNRFNPYGTSLYANETTFNVLLQHYKLEKARIEKELEEL